MLQISKQGNSIVVKGLDHALYPHSGTLEIPCNSVITVVDESEIVTFRSASNYDVLFSGLVTEITINGEAVTKENVGDKFGAISNTASSGGEGGLTPEQEQKLNNAVQNADYNADKEAQSAINESQNTAIEGLRGGLEGKQDKINDLDAIREGAALGATAIQEHQSLEGYATEQWVNDKNYATKDEIPSIDGFITETEADSKYQVKGDYITTETDPIWTAEKGDYYKTVEVDVLVNEAKSSANTAISIASSAEGIATAAHSRADEALEQLENKANKNEIPSLDGYATESWVEGKGYLTEHQDISGKLDKTEAAETYQPRGNYATKDEIPSLDGYATESWVESKGYLTEHQDISGKQDVITDLNEIREGAALGKTALQSFTETDPVWTAEKGNYYTKDEADGKFLTEHQDISGKLDKTEAEEIYQKKGEYVDVNTYNQHIIDQTAVDEAQNSAIEGIEGDITRIGSKADNALEGLNSKADKTDIKVYESKHPSEVTDENAIILNVVGTTYDLNNADNWRLITVPDAEQIYGYYFGVKVSDITSEEKEIGRLIPEQGEGYVALTVIRNDNTVTFKSTRSNSNVGYCYNNLYIHSVNSNTSLEIATYQAELSVVINLADNDYIIALGFEWNGGSGKFLTNGLYASINGQKPMFVKNDQLNMDKFITNIETNENNFNLYSSAGFSTIRFKRINGKIIIGDEDIITGAPNYVVDKELSEIPNGKGIAIDIMPNKVYLDLPNGTPHTVIAEEASKKYGCNFNYNNDIYFNGWSCVIRNTNGYISVTGNDGILTMYNATTNEPTTSVENNNYYIKLIEGASITSNNSWNPLYYEVGEPIEGLSYVKDSTPHKIALEDNLKTINGQSIIGSGNIEIQGGGITEETDPIWTAEKVNYYTKSEIDEMIGNINNALATLING